MDVFEAYEKYVHEDAKPSDTPKNEDLFELEGEKSTDGIQTSDEAKDNHIADLEAKIAKLTEIVEKLTTDVETPAEEQGEGE